jgi:hypothetical protein
MATILASSTSSVHIRSIILETSFGGFPYWQWPKNPFILTLDKWLPIHEILASALFVGLCTVEGIVNVYPPAGSELEWQTSIDLGEIDFMALLPTIAYYFIDDLSVPVITY